MNNKIKNFETNACREQLIDMYVSFETIEDLVSSENEINHANFQYLTLDPRSTELQNFDLGIEVTIPKLSEGKANLDPQHGTNPNLESSAIEESLEFDIEALPENAKLATVRPDADSIGAMAVLELRRSEIDIDESLVKAIGRADSYGFKRASELHPEIELRQKEITAASQKSLGKDTMEDKVLFMKKLLSGRADYEEIKQINDTWQEKRDNARKMLQLNQLTENSVLVTGNHPLAFEVGYEKAGIVAAINPNFKRPWIENDPETQKWTIARYSEKEPLDIVSLKTKLNELEKQYEGTGSWGGPVNLVASPQGETSKIPYEEIINAIKSSIINENQ